MGNIVTAALFVDEIDKFSNSGKQHCARQLKPPTDTTQIPPPDEDHCGRLGNNGSGYN